MNIDPLKNSGSSYSLRSVTNGRVPDQSAPTGQDNADSVSTEVASRVREALTSLPEIRPEVVERGRQLLADPSYPSRSIVDKIARLITPLSED